MNSCSPNTKQYAMVLIMFGETNFIQLYTKLKAICSDFDDFPFTGCFFFLIFTIKLECDAFYLTVHEKRKTTYFKMIFLSSMDLNKKSKEMGIPCLEIFLGGISIKVLNFHDFYI